MGSESDPGNLLKGLAESASRVKLAPGVIGKSSIMQIGSIALWIVIAFRLSADSYVLDGILVGAGCLVSYLTQRETAKMRKYAEDNPEIALMEGADIVEFRKFEAQIKGMLSTGARQVLTVDPKGKDA